MNSHDSLCEAREERRQCSEHGAHDHHSESHHSEYRHHEVRTPVEMFETLRDRIKHRIEEGGAKDTVADLLEELDKQLHMARNNAALLQEKSDSKNLKSMPGYYRERPGAPIRRNLLTSTLKHLGYYRGRRPG